MYRYVIQYHAATYSGTRTVWADDGDEAIAKVRRMIRKEMSLSMYSDSYKIIERED